jgi:hypothetical protein
MADQHLLDVHEAEPAAPPISISRLLHVLHAYFPAIILALVAVTAGYLILALGVYLFSPSQRVTTLPFRLDFEGATRGEYPNGTPFSAPEIVSTPVLLKVYDGNRLNRYTKFPDFARSIFVLESNGAYEALANDYQARLSDPRLTPVDRERLQREFEQKGLSISKNQYAISYLRPAENGAIPETIVRKVLAEILSGWAGFAVNEQRVLAYRVSVLSPDIIQPTSIDQDPLAAIHVLRTKTMQLVENIRAIGELPGADLARSTKFQMSLADVSIRLDEIVRFRLEPLLPTATSINPAQARRFLEIQLAYDQRQLAAQKDRVAAIREALDLYTQTQRPADANSLVRPGDPQAKPDNGPAGTSVVMTDTFLDRLTALTTNSADMTYRQKMTDQYRTLVTATVPLQLAVNYDEQALRELQSGATADPKLIERQLAETRSEIRQLVVTMNDIYATLSRNLNPSTALYSASVPYSRIQRSVELRRLAIGGILTIVLSLPLILIAVLLHHRVKREEQEEQAV